MASPASLRNVPYLVRDCCWAAAMLSCWMFQADADLIALSNMATSTMMHRAKVDLLVLHCPASKLSQCLAMTGNFSFCDMIIAC